MIVKNDVSPIWFAPAKDARKRLEAALAAGVSAAGGSAALHFRADDVAVVGAKLVRLFGLFASRRVPLAPSLVPAWLTPDRFRVLSSIAPSGTFAWHQHGWRHKNHEPDGKKCEFGAARSAEEKASDLHRGAERLSEICGGKNLPVFTPPWNRMDAEALAALAGLGFKAVSRTPEATPPCPEGLADHPVHVDLHTRRGEDPEADFEALLAEFEAGLATGVCGVMLHHQRMNQEAFAFLDLLLSRAGRTQGLTLTHLGELAS